MAALKVGSIMPRIRLAGDHSSYHCGSAAVVQTLTAELRRHGEIATDDSYDVLVVNGEGSMHHGGGAFREKMQLIEAAVARGRPACLINSVWQDNPHQFDPALAECRQVVMREVLSRDAIAAHGVTAQVMPDQSYFAPVDKGDIVDFKGGIVMTDFLSREFGCFVRLRSRWAERYPFVDMRAMDWTTLVRSLKTARLLLTGRHHAIYAACKARVPFLALAGNTHKIEGIVATAGADIPVFNDFARLRAAMDEAEGWQRRYDRLFDWFERQQPWQLTL